MPIDKLVLVSRRGFYEPAIAKAAYHRIEALTIQAALDTDWNAWAKKESSGIFSRLNIHFNGSARVIGVEGQHEIVDLPLTTRVRIGSALTTVGVMASRLLGGSEARDLLYDAMKGKEQGDFHAVYTDPAGVFKVNDDASETPIVELYIGMRVTLWNTPVNWMPGRFRDLPFVAGQAQDPSRKVEFALSATPDGERRGLLLDTDGLSFLTSDQTKPK